jgi:hypothetical protein
LIAFYEAGLLFDTAQIGQGTEFVLNDTNHLRLEKYKRSQFIIDKLQEIQNAMKNGG